MSQHTITITYAIVVLLCPSHHLVVNVGLVLHAAELCISVMGQPAGSTILVCALWCHHMYIFFIFFSFFF
jgi:hypothetical protein